MDHSFGKPMATCRQRFDTWVMVQIDCISSTHESWSDKNRCDRLRRNAWFIRTRKIEWRISSGRLRMGCFMATKSSKICCMCARSEFKRDRWSRKLAAVISPSNPFNLASSSDRPVSISAFWESVKGVLVLRISRNFKVQWGKGSNVSDSTNPHFAQLSGAKLSMSLIRLELLWRTYGLHGCCSQIHSSIDGREDECSESQAVWQRTSHGTLSFEAWFQTET